MVSLGDLTSFFNNVAEAGASSRRFSERLENPLAFEELDVRRDILQQRQDELAAVQNERARTRQAQRQGMERQRQQQRALGNLLAGSLPRVEGMRPSPAAVGPQPAEVVLGGITVPEEQLEGAIASGVTPGMLGQLQQMINPQAREILGGAIGERAQRIMDENPNIDFVTAQTIAQTPGITVQGGKIVPLAGVGGALGTIGGQEAYGTGLGGLQARLEAEPQVAQAVEEAKVRGGGIVTPREQQQREERRRELGAEAAIIASVDEFNNINEVIDSALGQADAATTGFASILSAVPGTPQADLAANLRTIEADSAFNRLQQMRDMSKTGGALGQVSERELALLGAARSALQQSQSPEQFKRNLRRYKEVRVRAMQNAAEAYQKDFGTLPEGVSLKTFEVNRQDDDKLQSNPAANMSNEELLRRAMGAE